MLKVAQLSTGVGIVRQHSYKDAPLGKHSLEPGSPTETITRVS